MADTSPHRPSPWVAFCAGAIATLALVLAWWAVRTAREAGEMRIVAPVPRLADFPDVPTPPRLPDIPAPKPK